MRNLEALVGRLKSPDDYFHGIASEYYYLPEDIVFFSCERFSDLSVNKPILHYRFNLVFCLKGAAHIYIDNRTLSLNMGESLLIFPFQNHYYISGGDKPILLFFIGFDLKERRNLEILRNNPVRTDLFVLSCITQMLMNNRKGRDIIRDALTVELLATILLFNASLSAERGGGDEKPDKMTEVSVITKIQRYVYNDIKRTLSTSILAGVAGISESGLHKNFKKTLGISPGRYVREARINHACFILEAGELSITETAAECGFDSVFSFSRAFRNATGYSPSAFKKRKTRRIARDDRLLS